MLFCFTLRDMGEKAGGAKWIRYNDSPIVADTLPRITSAMAWAHPTN